ncbi:uncharacterized protein TA18015 [Theileria annulata]|uniref:Uncharacterized protein n=1 Tax=Theileria annulata TaxID=5874 RepID=Q4UB46_THEAN|nr:uncharacterized protein TA18015 [Theileria annulata]CAI75955.1 hypothetical protein TA18015 [Theileria annulata]|eukprot:XP_955431.1 hypothetical protein TA18015 [Theileria annulata]
MIHSYRLYSFLFKTNVPYSINTVRLNLLKTTLTQNVSFYSSRIEQEGDNSSLDVDSCSKNNHKRFKSRNYLGSAEKSPTNSSHSSTNEDHSSENNITTLSDSEDCLVDAEISGLASPFSAMCWHKGPYSDYFSNYNSNHVSPTNDENDYTNNFRRNEISTQPNLVDEMEHLLSIERKEKDRVRLILEKNKPLKIDQQIRDKKLSSKVSTLKLLSISSRIASRRPASAKPQLDISEYFKEKRYQKLLLKDTNNSYKNREHKNNYRKETNIETIRVLDVDRLPLPILHHMLCYTLVKNIPAENVLKIISNIASLRDKNKHICYQNLFRLVVLNSSPICAPEIIATLTRSYQSISIPLMVDYVRKYGTFSRKFLSNLISRYSDPFPLDFLRYASHSRNLPMILTRPFSLISYVNLLKNCSAKRFMYLSLLNYGHVPNTQKFDKIHAYGTMDYKLSEEILSFEKLLDDNVLISDNKEDPNRPKIYDKILELQHSGESNLEDLELDPQPHEPTSTSLQFIKVLDQHQNTFNDTHHTQGSNQVYKDIDDSIPTDGSNVSWSLPWGLKRDSFHYRGKTYKLDPQRGWIGVKSSVRINFLKNVRMNKRKRERRLIRRRVTKEAKLKVLSTFLFSLFYIGRFIEKKVSQHVEYKDRRSYGRSCPWSMSMFYCVDNLFKEKRKR